MNQSRPRQFFQRVVNLRPGYPRPIPNLPPLQLEIGLITMHWPLREQAQEHQVRRRQRKSQGRAPDSSLSLCASQRSPRLCVILSLHFFPVLRSLLHHHHWHCSAGSRGLRACATAARNVSSTQGSCCWPLRRFRRAYILCGFCHASCATLRIPSNSKSRSIAGPIEIKSPNCRAVPPIKISLTWDFIPCTVH